MVRHLKYGVPVMIHGQRYAVLGNDPLHKLEVALRVFLFPEESLEYLARSVINRPHQGKPGTSALQPVMPAAVHQDEHPGLSVTLPPVAMLGWAPVARAGHRPADQ